MNPKFVAKVDEDGARWIKFWLLVILFFLLELLLLGPLTRKLRKQRLLSVENIPPIVKSEAMVQKQLVVLENEYLQLVLNTRGLIPEEVRLKKYRDEDGKKNVLLLDATTNRLHFGWISEDDLASVPDVNTLWQVVQADERNVTLEYRGATAIFRTVISLDNRYLLKVSQMVENLNEVRIYLQPIWKLRRRIDAGEVFSFTEGLGVFDDHLQSIRWKKIKNHRLEFPRFEWAGLANKYWLTILVNDNTPKGKVEFSANGGFLEMLYTIDDRESVKGKSRREFHQDLFLGAKDLDVLKDYAKNSQIRLLDRSIDFGFFYFLAKIFSWVLNFLYRRVGNFGIAIILLTLLLKSLLYPLVRKSFIALEIMKRIQPQLGKLQRIYANDKLKFQQETLKLYRRHNLNPFASLVPLLIQVPVFIALYRVIAVSLEMRQASFLWFIPDLSRADPTNVLNLFGLLPYGNSFRLGILPCLMAFSMYLQQKIFQNSDQEKKVTVSSETSEQINFAFFNRNFSKFMPVIFMFVFASFPSGLLLYWISSNILGILQQYYVVRVYLKKYDFSEKIYD
jgi:YidC/Oxa1 family membrane protein insertase